MVLQIEQFRKGIISLEGWPRRFTALFLGGLVVLALPPFQFWIFLVPGFVGLAWLIDGSQASKKRRYLRFTEWPSWSAFSVGWWFGVGFFAAGLYWVSFAFFGRGGKVCLDDSLRPFLPISRNGFVYWSNQFGDLSYFIRGCPPCAELGSLVGNF